LPIESSTVNKRRPSIHDVAKHAGVSAATVSKVIEGNQTVKVRNIERVLASVGELGYRVDPVAADLRRNERRIVGAIVPEFESAFFGSIIAQLELEAEKRGYTLVATSSRESEDRERELLNRMHDWRVAGVIVAPVRNEHGPAAEVMKHFRMRGVFIDRVLSDDVFDTVSSNGAQASAQVARELVTSNHRHFLLVTFDEEAASLQARLNEFRRQALELDPACVIDVIRCASDPDALRSAVRDYFNQGLRPTAIYSLFLKATLVVVAEVRRRGWSIPDDVSIVAFDHDEWMDLMHPPMSAVVQPTKSIASTAMQRLFSRVAGEKSPPIATLEPCKVIMRGSVRPRTSSS
jgi:LacI family transcriptional regulator